MSFRPSSPARSGRSHSRVTDASSRIRRRSYEFSNCWKSYGPHAPADAQVHLQVALALEPVQRVAHRRAAHRQPLGDLRLREAVARDQREVEDAGLELLVGDLGERALRHRGRHHLGGRETSHRGAGSGMRLTCAATMRHPSGKRTQVWLWRPMRSLPARRNSMFAVAKSVPNVVITILVSVRASPGRRTRRAERRDGVVTVQVLRRAVAQRGFVAPEELVEHGDVVADQRRLVAVERGAHFRDDLGSVDFEHRCVGQGRRGVCFTRGSAARARRQRRMPRAPRPRGSISPRATARQ